MIIAISLVVLAILFTLLQRRSSAYDSTYWVVAAMLWICSAVAGISLVCNRMDVMARIAGIEAIRHTPRGQDYDSAAWRSKIAEENAWLATTQYYKNHTMFGDWIPDDINRVEPLR